MKNQKQPFIPGEYDIQEKIDLCQQGIILNPYYEQSGITTGETKPSSQVDMYLFNRTGGTSFAELKYRDNKYNNDSGTTIMEVEKVDFLIWLAERGFGAFIYNMYKGTDEMHLFHINAIVDELKSLQKKPVNIKWGNSIGSGVKREYRYFIPNELAYKVKTEQIVSKPQKNKSTPAPKKIAIDTGRKITQSNTYWIIDE